MGEQLLQSRTEGVLTLTMNRPDRLNALTMEMLAEMHEVLDRAAFEAEVRVIVLTGAGRGFCAGGDVKSMAQGSERGASLEARAVPLRRRMEVSRLLHDMDKPTIAMMRGPAAGAGLSLALACDLRIASETVKLTTAFAKVALSGDFGGSWFLNRLVGSAKARELYLTSPLLDAAEAHRLGLVNRIVADDPVARNADGMAKLILAHADLVQEILLQNCARMRIAKLPHYYILRLATVFNDNRQSRHRGRRDRPIGNKCATGR